jgi:hypothetical protein
VQIEADVILSKPDFEAAAREPCIIPLCKANLKNCPSIYTPTSKTSLCTRSHSRNDLDIYVVATTRRISALRRVVFSLSACNDPNQRPQ